MSVPRYFGDEGVCCVGFLEETVGRVTLHECVHEPANVVDGVGTFTTDFVEGVNL